MTKVSNSGTRPYHDDVIKWKHFPRYWPFLRGIHRSPMNSPHKGQWRGALVFTLIYAWINGWVNNREAGGLRRHWAHYDAIVMYHNAVLGWDRSHVIWDIQTNFESHFMDELLNVHNSWRTGFAAVVHVYGHGGLVFLRCFSLWARKWCG